MKKKSNATKIVGANDSTEKEILNAAITPWAGFIYQGLCAICVTMEKLLDDPDADKYFLNLEGYDDFAILDENRRILSFHQCKDFKSSQNHSVKNECGKMEDKKTYWSKPTHGSVSDNKTELFLHAPVDLQLYNNVSAYKYRKSQETKATITDLYGMIGDLISEYNVLNGLPGSATRKRDRLTTMVEEHVMKLDSYKYNNQQQLGTGVMLKYSVSKSIPFKDIVQLLHITDDGYTQEEKARTSIFYISYYMQDRLDKEFYKPSIVSISEKINRFLNALGELDIDAQFTFVKKIFPHIDLEDKNAIAEISNSERVDILYNVLTDVNEEVDTKALDWYNAKKGLKLCPSTLGSSRDSEEYCGMIVNNKNVPPDLLRDYDFIVGDIKESVDDIIKSAHIITNIKDTNYYKITGNRKVGLLTIEDKNNL